MEWGFYWSGDGGQEGEWVSVQFWKRGASNFDIRKAVGNPSVDNGRARDVKESWF